MEGARPPRKNKVQLNFLMRIVKDHTKTIKPHCQVNATKITSWLENGSYQTTTTPWKMLKSRDK